MMDVSHINFNEMNDIKTQHSVDRSRIRKKTVCSQPICSYLSLNVILNYYRKCIDKKKKCNEMRLPIETVIIVGNIRCVLGKLLNMDEAIAVEKMFMVINDRFELI